MPADRPCDLSEPLMKMATKMMILPKILLLTNSLEMATESHSTKVFSKIFVQMVSS